MKTLKQTAVLMLLPYFLIGFLQPGCAQAEEAKPSLPPQAAKPAAQPPGAAAAEKPVPFDFHLDERPFIAAKYVVEVDAYEPGPKVYHIKRAQFPDATGLYVTPESLLKAVSSLDAQTLKRHPRSVVGNEYMTDNDLMILSILEAEEIQPTVSKKKSRH